MWSRWPCSNHDFKLDAGQRQLVPEGVTQPLQLLIHYTSVYKTIQRYAGKPSCGLSEALKSLGPELGWNSVLGCEDGLAASYSMSWQHTWEGNQLGISHGMGVFDRRSTKSFQVKDSKPWFGSWMPDSFSDYSNSHFVCGVSKHNGKQNGKQNGNDFKTTSPSGNLRRCRLCPVSCRRAELRGWSEWIRMELCSSLKPGFKIWADLWLVNR